MKMPQRNMRGFPLISCGDNALVRDIVVSDSIQNANGISPVVYHRGEGNVLVYALPKKIVFKMQAKVFKERTLQSHFGGLCIHCSSSELPLERSRSRIGGDQYQIPAVHKTVTQFSTLVGVYDSS